MGSPRPPLSRRLPSISLVRAVGVAALASPPAAWSYRSFNHSYGVFRHFSYILSSVSESGASAGREIIRDHAVLRDRLALGCAVTTRLRHYNHLRSRFLERTS